MTRWLRTGASFGGWQVVRVGRHIGFAPRSARIKQLRDSTALAWIPGTLIVTAYASRSNRLSVVRLSWPATVHAITEIFNYRTPALMAESLRLDMAALREQIAART